MTTRFTRTTGRTVAVGAFVGLVASYLPFVSLVAPLVAGGVAGFLEGGNVRRGSLVGGLTGLVVAVAESVLSVGIAAATLGVGGVEGVSATGLLLAGALWIVAAAGQAVVAGVGGALGAVVRADRTDRAARSDADRSAPGVRAVPLLASLLAAVVTFAGVGLGVTALLDPYIWPSMLVGIPVGAVTGAAVGVLGYHVLVTRAGDRGPGGTSGAS
ncbi:DUF5518 domain-containing protein [Halogeometricum limi]|uniref:DUF8147 domain-containing protein n=1 Tax=Halogeometricum limi TaxID=555875 RepID=A0A1I6I9R8_9EURY|nr:DUF5518 domain-containing protein [Halogeometricum limi]SFR63446.1 hypothetical protein SAMN04488124_2900 [Halogeometricum limi]